MAYAKEYTDDAGIGDEDRLWRRLLREQVVFDPKLARRRPSSAAFSDSSDGTALSVNIVKLRDSDDADEFLQDHPGNGLAEFTAGTARVLNQGVAHTPEEGDPDHGSVWDKGGHRSKKTKSGLAKVCFLLRDPGVAGA